MRRTLALSSCLASLLLLSSCSPRDFLTRRLAADLISTSETFRAQQQFELRTGVISNEDYRSPSYRALQHHGWISATNAPCPPAKSPPLCWDVTLTPAGVDPMQSLIVPGDAEKQSFTITAAHRELIAITGIAKQGNTAEVEFTWRWLPANEVGAALYPTSIHYRSKTILSDYDDGWRIVQSNTHPAQPLDEALKNAEQSQ